MVAPTIELPATGRAHAVSSSSSSAGFAAGGGGGAAAAAAAAAIEAYGGGFVYGYDLVCHETCESSPYTFSVPSMTLSAALAQREVEMKEMLRQMEYVCCVVLVLLLLLPHIGNGWATSCVHFR